MINFEELIKSLILPLVAYPEEVEITCVSEEERNLKFQVKVNPADFGRILGRGGNIIHAIRTILYAGASKEGIKIYLDVDSKN